MESSDAVTAVTAVTPAPPPGPGPEDAARGASGLSGGPYELAEALVLAAGLVPPGRAVSYGALAGLLGAGGPRQAGRAMSRCPDGTPWWRVVRADGTLPASLSARAAPHYRDEGTPLRGHGAAPDGGAPVRVDLAAARWEPDAGARAALAGLRAALGRPPGSAG
ncbi:MGMT family protein [Citricoccus sp. SGAir0253]|uniref:MGMT family protein n=1 Tax=Citricoccus sp. SGAir0253 TaxID=2567881 RepID=UPI001FEEE56B|nr:MGMT family protein [Citricoccus sp. SGAir0253]